MACRLLPTRSCKKKILAFAFALLPLLLLCGATGAASAADVTLFAAASLKESLDAVAQDYMRQSADRSVISYGASSALVRQIENGAPADLFLSADLDWMDYLAQRKLIDPASRRNLLGNQLVLIASAASADTLKIGPGFALAARLGSEKLAMANPDAVPAGKYGKAALQALGVWPAVEGKVARAENVRAALLLVARGEARYGIVYRTDALAEPKVRIVDTFPASSHAPIVYPAALTASAAPAAKKLLDYMQGEPAAAIWRKFGFTVLK